MKRAFEGGEGLGQMGNRVQGACELRGGGAAGAIGIKEGETVAGQ